MKIKIKDIGKTITGKTPSTKEKKFFGGDILFVTPSDITNGGYIENTERHITKLGYDSIKNNALSGGISILIGCIGSDMGNVSWTDKICASNQQINSITNIKKEINPWYIYYKLSQMKLKFKQLAGSTTTPILPKSVFDEIILELQEKSIQDKITNLIMRIDKKIELNNKINSELENMAKTIYDYWFLQFEFPNDEGKPYKSSGGKMVWNEELKKEIPNGWEVKKLEKFITLTRGVTYSKEDISSEEKENYFPLLKSNNIQNGRINYNNIIYVKNSLVSEKQILDKGSIFITMSSGSKEHMGKTAIIFDNLKYTFGAFCSKVKIKNDFTAFISLFFVSKLFKNIIDNLTLGTSINNINNDHINNIKITVPNEKTLQLFEDKLKSIFKKQGKIIFENQELTSLRDYLLPLLMNGQVGFKD